MQVALTTEEVKLATATDPKSKTQARTPAKAETGRTQSRRSPEQARPHLKTLLLANPNYFGTLKESKLPKVLDIAYDTTFEKIACVGFQPELSQLEAVVYINQTTGYGGDVCTGGSQEYVRFYLSFDGGTTWQDQGMVNFTVYDVSGEKPLEYDATLPINPAELFCFIENLPTMRAILSWNNPPPAGTPNFIPIWGNVVDGRIQIQPGSEFVLAKVLEQAKVQLPELFASALDLTKPVGGVKPKALSIAQLEALYKDAKVPPHRFLFSEIQGVQTRPSLTQFGTVTSPSPLTALGAKLEEILVSLSDTNGDTSYEELDCVGLDPNASALVGTLTVKQPLGYLGDLCTAGSQEYVAFWVDWGDGAGLTWQGTAQVNVHDISSIPPGGLEYAVFQPVNLGIHRKPCDAGPFTPRVRAILSWDFSPPPGYPDFVPTWGNRVETKILVNPGPTVVTGDYTPYIESICGVAVCAIDQTTGFAEPGDQPFGGGVGIYGSIPGAPSRLTPSTNRPRYRISVRPYPAGPWQHLTDTFNVTINEYFGVPPVISTPNVPQSVDATDYYTYQDAPNVPGIGWRSVVPLGLLAEWNTSGKTGLWEIMIEALDPVTSTTYVAGTTLCVLDGTMRQNVIIDLDQAAPTTSISITDYSNDGGVTWNPAVDCGTLQVGVWIRGNYTVTDQHFGSFSLRVEPTPDGDPGAFTIDGIATNTRSYPAIPTTGQSGTWILNTGSPEALVPCGYTVQVLSNDRTIANCCCPWENNNSFVGFCLVAAT